MSDTFFLKNAIGDRCKVCTGCGRCLREMKGLDIIKSSPLLSCLSLDIDSYLYAVDIGTTTIAMVMYDKKGKPIADRTCLNPQYRFGRDVLSRIAAAEDKYKAKLMQKQCVDEIEKGFEYFDTFLPAGEEKRAIVCANTTMTLLALGKDVSSLGKAPFNVPEKGPFQIVIGGTDTMFVQSLSAFIGGDIVAGIKATGMDQKEDISLLIDLGTNAEMVLGNKDRFVTTSASAGPAFESGAGAGKYGTDLVKNLAALLESGIMDETGLLSETYFDEGVMVGDTLMTQKLIRDLQLAKAAIRTGIDLLIKAYGIGYRDVSKVYLAGGFGYYLDEAATVKIGMIPEEFLGKCTAVGNTGLTGALVIAQECEDEENCMSFSDNWNVELVEAANEDTFQEKYTNNLNF